MTSHQDIATLNVKAIWAIRSDNPQKAIGLWKECVNTFASAIKNQCAPGTVASSALPGVPSVLLEEQGYFLAEQYPLQGVLPIFFDVGYILAACGQRLDGQTRDNVTGAVVVYNMAIAMACHAGNDVKSTRLLVQAQRFLERATLDSHESPSCRCPILDLFRMCLWTNMLRSSPQAMASSRVPLIRSCVSILCALEPSAFPDDLTTILAANFDQLAKSLFPGMDDTCCTAAAA